MTINLLGLPKTSTNKIYAGMHWTKRKKLKDAYKAIITSQFKTVFPKTNEYEVEYNFQFKSRALDITNCSFMIKMIEDVIFQDDSYKIIKRVTITSERGSEDNVTITVKEL